MGIKQLDLDEPSPRAGHSPTEALTQVASPPGKPLMIFDGDCSFCRYWIERWRRLTASRVDYLPFQDPHIGRQFPEIPIEACREAVQLVEADGRVSSAAEAVLRTLSHVPRRGWPLWLYRHIPGVAGLTEWGYRRVSRNRELLWKVTQTLARTSDRPR